MSWLRHGARNPRRTLSVQQFPLLTTKPQVIMELHILSQQNTVLNKFIAQIRDREVQTDSMRFRRNMERIGEITAYELSKELNYTPRLSVAMLFEYFDCKEEGALIRKAVDASLDENVRTPEIQVADGAKYGTKEVGQWIVDYIKKA